MNREARIEKYREGLNELFVPRYEALFKTLKEDWWPYSGLRSMEEQEAIYAQGRTKPGKVVSQAQAGDSAHNYGCAVDLTIFNKEGEPCWDHDRWQELVHVCKLCGLTWGGEFGDRPHVQLSLKLPYRRIGLVYRAVGLKEAMRVIAKNVER